MAFVLSKFKAMIKHVLNRIPPSALEKIEDVTQKQLGKGSGAWATNNEARNVAEFVKALAIQEVVAIDAGANLGNWTDEFNKCLPEATVFAFEPSRDAFLQLKERFIGDSQVEVINLALGKENRFTNLYADKSGSGLGSLTKRRVDHFNIEFDHSERIEIQKLDTWIADRAPSVPPNVLKMDVEGHELDILLGATEALKNIQIVQFEFGGGNIDTKTFFQDFWYFFKNSGFAIFRLTPGKPILIQTYSEQDEVFRATNYIAVRSKNAQ